MHRKHSPATLYTPGDAIDSAATYALPHIAFMPDAPNVPAVFNILSTSTAPSHPEGVTLTVSNPYSGNQYNVIYHGQTLWHVSGTSFTMLYMHNLSAENNEIEVANTPIIDAGAASNNNLFSASPAGHHTMGLSNIFSQ